MSDYAQYKDLFERDGFIVVKQVLPPSAFDDLVQNVKRYRNEVVPHFEEGNEAAMYGTPERQPEMLIRLNGMHQHDDFFRQYPYRPEWIELAETLLGEPVTPTNVVWFNKPPASVHPNHPTPPHQDNHYYYFDPPQMLSMWLALEPVDANNGCLRYVVGSHKKGFRPHTTSSLYGFSQGISDYSPDDWPNEMRMCLQPGDMIVHHCMTIHRADANDSTDRHREAIDMIFEGKSAKVDQAMLERHQEQVRLQHAKLGRKATA